MSDRAFLGPANTYLENRQIVFAEDYEKLERELAEAKAQIQKACAELPVSYYPDNTPEKLAGNIAGLVKDYTENYRELEEHRDELVRRGIEIAGYINKLSTIHSPESRVWIWQGDGSDHPESMANYLPVVMTASTLREKQAEVQSLREQLTAHKAALEKSAKIIELHRATFRYDPEITNECDEALFEIAKLKGSK